MISSSQRPLPDDTQHSKQTSTPPVGFEPTVSAGKRPQTHTLYRVATGTVDRGCQELQIRKSDVRNMEKIYLNQSSPTILSQFHCPIFNSVAKNFLGLKNIGGGGHFPALPTLQVIDMCETLRNTAQTILIPYLLLFMRESHMKTVKVR